MREIENFFLKEKEPIRSCLAALRYVILHLKPDITELWKYNMPFFCYKGKMMCYLWMHKKHNQPYIGFVDGKRLNHPALIAEKRSRIKILLIDPAQDIPINEINAIVKEVIALYN